MLEAARLIRSYTARVTFEEFFRNNEKRDAVALRFSVPGESAHKIGKATEAALPSVPFKSIRGMRNRIARDYGTVDSNIVWDMAKKEIPVLIRILRAFLKIRSAL